MSSSKNISWIWKHASKISDEEVKCNDCGKKYTNKGGTTTPIANHLKTLI